MRRMATSVTATIELKLYMIEADEMEARHRVSRKKKNFPATGCKPGNMQVSDAGTRAYITYTSTNRRASTGLAR